MVPRLKILFAVLVTCVCLPAHAVPSMQYPEPADNARSTLPCSTSMGIVGLGAILALGAAALVSFRVVRLNHLLATEIEQRQKLYSELESIAKTDHLTGLPNRRTFMDALDKEMHRSSRNKRDTCLALIDLDFFKSVNDPYGHVGGDEVRTVVADTVKDMLREQDTPGRIGGEEFAVCLPETDADQAFLVAERIRTAVEQTQIEFDSKAFTVTASIGVAHMMPGETRDKFIHRADTALYRAKHEGRNRVCLAPESLA